MINILIPMKALFFWNSNYHYSYKIFAFFWKRMRLDQNQFMSFHSSFVLPHTCKTLIKLYIYVQTCHFEWNWTDDGFKITSLHIQSLQGCSIVFILHTKGDNGHTTIMINMTINWQELWSHRDYFGEMK